MAKFDKIIDKNQQYAQYMVDEINDICSAYPSRSAGSESEVATAERFADTLKNQCGCDEVSVEK
ncbi:MAG: hypothetical protein J6R34_00775, partial [Clostridia bacterium]|nr:hypothetical protein [Clostridia bacterium]